MIDFNDLNLKNFIDFATLIFMSNLNFVLSLVEHEKLFITSGPAGPSQYFGFRN